MRPVTDDVDTEGFFSLAADGKLGVATCGACRAVLHPPTGICPACGAVDVVWRAVAPTGSLVTWTVVERQVNEAFPTPYTVVLVALDEVPEACLVGQLPGRHELVPGEPMVAHFDDDSVLPQWRRVDDRAASPHPPAGQTQGDGA